MKTNPIYQKFCKKLDFFQLIIGSWTYGGLEVDLQHRDSHIERAETEKLVGFDGEYDETVWIVDEGYGTLLKYRIFEIEKLKEQWHQKEIYCEKI